MLGEPARAPADSSQPGLEALLAAYRDMHGRYWPALKQG